MRKQILEYLKTGRIKEAVGAALALSVKRGVEHIHNELIVVAGQLHRAEREYLMNLISLETREKVETRVSMLLMEYVPFLKKI